MTPSPINMQRLAPSKSRPRAGDIFALQMHGRPFMFGRVIRTDASIGNFPSLLIYIYRNESNDKRKSPILSRDALLLPPIGTNERNWAERYFETVGHAPLTSDDVLSVHCFIDPIAAHREVYRDECGNILDRRHEPCGIFALHGYYQIDCDISDTLGIARAPRPNDPIG